MTATHGQTAVKELTVAWDYPVYTPDAEDIDGTREVLQRKALEAVKAYKSIAGEDTRPLLILREFATFDDPDNEKLSRKLFTEKSVLMSHWFHCVRMPAHVSETDHPFHTLFEGDDPPHLMFASHDGSNLIVFRPGQPASDLIEAMTRTLTREYDGDVKGALKKMVRMIPQFDKLDAHIRDLKVALDRELEGKGPRSKKAKKITRDLDKAEKRREELLQQRDDLRDIPLRVAKVGGGDNARKAG